MSTKENGTVKKREAVIEVGHQSITQLPSCGQTSPTTKIEAVINQGTSNTENNADPQIKTDVINDTHPIETEVKDVLIQSLYVDHDPFFDKPNDRRPHLETIINGIPTTVLVDTGAMECVIGVTEIGELNKYNAILKPTQITVTTLHTKGKNAAGEMTLCYTIGSRTVPLNVIVVQTFRPQVLVGMTFCRAFGIKLTIDPECFVEVQAVATPPVRMLNAWGMWNATEATKLTKKSRDVDDQSFQRGPSSGESSPVSAEEVKGQALGQITQALQALTEMVVSLQSNNQSRNEKSSTADTSLRAESGTTVNTEAQPIEFDTEITWETIAQVFCRQVGAIVNEHNVCQKNLGERMIKYQDCSQTLMQLHEGQKAERTVVSDRGEIPSNAPEGVSKELATAYTIQVQSFPAVEILEMMLQPQLREPRENQPGKKRRQQLRVEARINEISTIEQDNGVPTVRTADGVTDTESDVMPEKIPCVTKPHELSKEEQLLLKSVVDSFPYTPETGPLNKTPIYTQYIQTGDARPEMRKQYPLSPYVTEEVNKEIQNLISRDIIEPLETSPWRWPILWVKKKSGGGRICLDARGLNELTVPDAYPQLNVDVILRSLPKAKYITCLDMTQAFHQIEIAPEDRKKNSFCCRLTVLLL